MLSLTSERVLIAVALGSFLEIRTQTLLLVGLGPSSEEHAMAELRPVRHQSGLTHSCGSHCLFLSSILPFLPNSNGLTLFLPQKSEREIRSYFKPKALPPMQKSRLKNLKRISILVTF